MGDQQPAAVEFIDEEIYDPTPSNTSASNDSGDSRTDSAGSSNDSDEQETTNQTQSEKGESAEKQADSAPATKSDSNKQQPNKEKFGNRYEQRKQEMQAIRDEIRQEREQLSKLRTVPNGQAPNDQTKAQAEVEIIPKPTPPQYSKEDLTKWYNDAKAKGDEATMQACVDGFKAHEKHEQDMRFWKIENGQQFKEFEKTWNDNWTKTTAKFPELKDKNSELWKEADKLARKYPEILNRKQADGQSVIAQVAAMRLKIKSHDSVVGALKEKLAKTEEQLAKYQKRAQPAGQGNKPNLDKPGSGGSPLERLASKLGVAA